MDDEESRLIFERELISIWKRKTQNCVLLNRAEYNSKLQRLIELENPQVPKTAQDFRLLKCYNYIVQDNGGHQTRRLCKRGTNFLFVPIEEMFEILKSAHIQLRHAGRNSLQLFFRNKYCNITKDCIMTFLALCKACPRKKKIREVRPKTDPSSTAALLSGVTASATGIEMMDDEDEIDVDGTLHGTGGASSSSTSTLGHHFNSINGGLLNNGNNSNNWMKQEKNEYKYNKHSGGTSSAAAANGGGGQTTINDTFTRGQVDIIDMRKQPDGEFTYIFKFINLHSMEIRLKPMQYGTPMEAANLLIDIYCEQGAPVILQSVNGREFAKDVVMEISKLWPSCRQLHGAIRVLNNNDFGDNGIIMEQLVVMQKRFNTNVWAHLLRFLQWEINSSYNNDLGCSVIEHTLKRQPTLGLPSSKLLEAVYDKAQSEEQMMDYIADAELLRLTAFCSNACQQAQQQQQIMQAPPRPSMPRIHRPPISATASVTVNPGHFIDESQLMGHPQQQQNETKPQTQQQQNGGGIGGVMSSQNEYHTMQNSSGTITVSSSTSAAAAMQQQQQQQRNGVSPPLYLDYRSLHMSVEQERQQQQQQQQHSAHHSVQHSPAPQQQQPQQLTPQPSQIQQQQQATSVYLQQQQPPQMETPQPQQQQPLTQPTSVYLPSSMTSMEPQQQQPPQVSQQPQQQVQAQQTRYVNVTTTSLDMLQDMLDQGGHQQQQQQHNEVIVVGGGGDPSQQQQQQNSNHLSNNNGQIVVDNFQL